MKRNNLRKMLLILSLLLFPVTIWYMSPYLIIQGAMEGIINGSFIIFVSMLVGSIFFGRLFCSWICPMGGLQENLSSVNNKNPKQGWKNFIKYFIWVIWIAAVIICFIFKKEKLHIDFFYMTDHGISISSIYNYVIYYGVIILVLIPSIIGGRRAFCHYFCWMAPFMVVGTGIRKVLHLPGLHIESDNKKCLNCSNCNKNCPMGLNVNKRVQENKSFGMECIQCGNCIYNCPSNVLKFSWKPEGK